MQECRFKCHTVCSNKKWIHLSNRQLITIIKGGGIQVNWLDWNINYVFVVMLQSLTSPLFFFCNSQWRMYSAVSCTYTGARHPTKWGHWKTYPFMATFSFQLLASTLAVWLPDLLLGLGKNWKRPKVRSKPWPADHALLQDQLERLLQKSYVSLQQTEEILLECHIAFDLSSMLQTLW